MYFSQNALQQLEKERLTMFDKYANLMNAYIYRSYNVERAREHAYNGFSRRLKTLVRCIENIFETLPPDQVALPTREDLSDVTINLQAFLFNVFGCVDNLAWILVWEKKLTKDNGSPIPNGWVRLRKKNKFVRQSLSPEFLEHLNQLEKWFENHENYRHALAHRIPLYVPPYIITQDKEAAYQELGTRMSTALKCGALDEYDRLSEAQNALGEFKPIMTHSFVEQARPIFFHSQVLIDFNTIEALGRKMFEELDR